MVSTKFSSVLLLAVVLTAAQVPVPEPTPPPTSLTAIERGDLYMVRRMFREAIATYQTGPQDSPVTWDKIGIAWHSLGELSLALKSYKHALKVDKHYTEAINNIGTVYYSRKQYRSAISRYKQAIALDPGKASYWSNLGMAYFSESKLPQSMASFAQAIALDPEIFEQRGVYGTAMQDRTVTDRARYHFELARLYAKLGRNELALQYLRHSFEEGFKDKDKVRKAPEFAGMLKNPEFLAVMALDPRVL